MEMARAVYRSLVGPAEGAKKLHMHLTELDTREGGWPKQHAHAAEEALFVLEGEAEFAFGGEVHRVGPGDAVFFPSGVQHAEAKFFTDHMKYVVVRTVEPGDPPCCCQ